jgi:cytochrome c-type biogenesis protein
MLREGFFVLDVGLAASFGAGIVSFLSPCILPLVPAYLCFLAGASLETLKDGVASVDKWRVIGRAAAFVIGFSLVFIALGASASTFGQLISDRLGLLSQVAGLIIVLLGLHLLGVLRLVPLMREVRFNSGRPASLLGALVVGLAFGFGWTPCVGPVLTSILLLATSEESVSRGTALLTAYAAGIGVPFFVAAIFTGSFLRWFSRFRGYLGAVEKAMGGALVVTGILVFSGSMPLLGAWLLETVPILGRIG